MNLPWIEQASRQKKIMVGVSGGLDSVALLHLVHEAGFRKVVVCHVDHGLRGRESTADAKFVRDLANRLAYDVMVEKTDLRAVMKKTGDSLETAGRAVRHAFFASCGAEQRCRTVLLAHHADDQAETVLWNLLRGSLGSRGMSAVTTMKMGGRDMTVVRPLLAVRKSDLREWMQARKFTWREDSSNAVNDVVRNRLRNEVIPLLNEITKRDVTASLVRAAAVDDGWRELLEWSQGQVRPLDPQGRLHTGAMKNLPRVLSRSVIADYLKKQQIDNVDWRLLEKCVELLDVEKPASVNLPGGRRLRRKAGRLFVEEI
jgi:tRNA(Ile)-lysidine synthase